jgi:hypothetical protein
MDPVYFLEDSVSRLSGGTAIPRCALGLSSLCSSSATSVLNLFLSPKNKKRPDLSERFSIFKFLFSKYPQTFCIAGNSPLVFSSICSFR